MQGNPKHKDHSNGDREDKTEAEPGKSITGYHNRKMGQTQGDGHRCRKKRHVREKCILSLSLLTREKGDKKCLRFQCGLLKVTAVSLTK